MIDARNLPNAELAVRLPGSGMQENVVTLTYGPDFRDELSQLSGGKPKIDVIVVDCTAAGYLFPAEVMIEAVSLVKNVLVMQGALIFVRSDKAVAMVKESMVGTLTMHVFETLAQVFDYSPFFAQTIQLTLGERSDLPGTSSDLTEQILLSSVPVLTALGMRLKSHLEVGERHALVLAAVDCYSPVGTIAQKLNGKLNFNEVQEVLKALEANGAIYPVFARIPYLMHCVRNKLPFKLRDYLLQSGLASREELESLTVAAQADKSIEHLSLGALVVSRGLISSRQLEIAMQDQAFYGAGSDDRIKISHVKHDQESRVHSLVGHLGTTEAANLLQNLQTNRENGVLSVERSNSQFRAVFEHGRMVKARQGKLRGNEAVVEFVTTWKDGVFVFLERQTPPDLAEESCTVSRPLDKLLLDSALASDNIESVWKRLPKGIDTPLERCEDTGNLIMSGNMVDPQEGYPLSAVDIAVMERLWSEFDGLVTIAQTIKKLGDLTTARAATAIGRLMHYQLARVPQTDLALPLEKFQGIVYAVANRIGVDRSIAFLRLSLQASQGYSAKARMFKMGKAGEIGVDLSLARLAGVSLSEVVKQLENWQVSYVEYCSNELDKASMRDIVASVYRKDLT